MQYTQSGAISIGRARIQGMTISAEAGGTLQIKNGGASGDVVWSFTAPSAPVAVYVPFADDGLLVINGYAALNDVIVTIDVDK